MDDIAVNSDLPDLCFVYVEENKSRRISVKMCFISEKLKDQHKGLVHFKTDNKNEDTLS